MDLAIFKTHALNDRSIEQEDPGLAHRQGQL